MTSQAQISLEALGNALDQTHEVLLSVSPDRMHDPTPCMEWNVSDLIAHLVADPPQLHRDGLGRAARLVGVAAAAR